LIEYNRIGFYKYKPKVFSEADCIREYPITKYILSLIEQNQIPFEIEMENGQPKLINGLTILLV